MVGKFEGVYEAIGGSEGISPLDLGLSFLGVGVEGRFKRTGFWI